MGSRHNMPRLPSIRTSNNATIIGMQNSFDAGNRGGSWEQRQQSFDSANPGAGGMQSTVRRPASMEFPDPISPQYGNMAGYPATGTYFDVQPNVLDNSSASGAGYLQVGQGNSYMAGAPDMSMQNLSVSRNLSTDVYGAAPQHNNGLAGLALPGQMMQNFSQNMSAATYEDDMTEDTRL